MLLLFNGFSVLFNPGIQCFFLYNVYTLLHFKQKILYVFPLVAIFFIYFCLDKPHIVNTPSTTVNESDRVVLTKEIISNPLPTVSWYKGSKLLKTETLVRTATFTIEKAVCTDTMNLTLIASNTVQRNVSSLVELIVNCKYFFPKVKSKMYYFNFILETIFISKIF